MRSASSAYRTNLKKRLREGKAGALEPVLWAYAYGKPRETVSIDSPEGVVVTFGGRYKPPDEKDAVPLPPGSYGTRGPF